MNREERERLARKAAELYLQVEEDEDAENWRREERRSSKKNKQYVECDRESGYEKLNNDCFAENSTYTDTMFRRRFSMRRDIFLRIVDSVTMRDPYFQQRSDATGQHELHPLQKCTMALRQFAYGGTSDEYDEYLLIADSTGRECLKHFCRTVIAAFGDEYLRRPHSRDVECLIQMHEAKHGFPSMLGSIDCMHWGWKNCPSVWKAVYANFKKRAPTVIFEAVCSTDLWIWHAFNGVAGSNNDINVLNQSDVFNDYLRGVAQAVNFTVNNTQYNMGYYPADDIYPKWPTFMKTVPCPTDPKRALFAMKQEDARKDIKRAFSVLQARWTIVRGPAHMHYIENLTEIMYACVIMHNMIIEDEGEAAENWKDDESSSSTTNPLQARRSVDVSFARYMQRNASLRNATAHENLEKDMIEEI